MSDEQQEPTCTIELVHASPEPNEKYPWSGLWPPPRHIAVARVRPAGRPAVTTVMDAMDWVQGISIAPHATAVLIYDQVATIPSLLGGEGRLPLALYTRRIELT